MKKYYFIYLFLALVIPSSAKCNVNDSAIVILLKGDSAFLNPDFPKKYFGGSESRALWNSFPDTIKLQSSSPKHKRLVAAFLSFPLPFGILGLHRIYLGTKPYMPFVYVGTLGGCFGILPLIDFITILISGDEKLKSFENNSKVFMWVR